MEKMLKSRLNRIKYLIKLNFTKKISNEDFITEYEKLSNEIYFLKQLTD